MGYFTITQTGLTPASNDKVLDKDLRICVKLKIFWGDDSPRQPQHILVQYLHN